MKNDSQGPCLKFKGGSILISWTMAIFGLYKRLETDAMHFRNAAFRSFQGFPRIKAEMSTIIRREGKCSKDM